MTEETFETYGFRTDDGLTLRGRIYGRVGGRPPVFCLAGLSRNSRDFHLLARRLAAGGRAVVTLDYRGRGLSDRDPDAANYSVAREAQDVLLALAHLKISKAAFIGTSRGGLILHVLGGMENGPIAAAVLNDIGPVIEIEGLRHIRDYLSDAADFETLDAARMALERRHGREFTALGDHDWRDMADAIFRNSDGKWVADFDPALVAPLRALDLSQPLPSLWPQFDQLARMPLMIIRGENSSLLSAETAREMAARHSHAVLVEAPGQGHAPLLHVEPVYAAIAGFLDGNS